jgi:energy-coupling factor transporter ATPase
MIEFKHVSYAYEENAPQALRDVNLVINEGEFVAIIGHNGSGKSTLAQHINALYRPDQGTVLIDGMDTADPAYLFTIRSTAGMVFQNPDSQMVASIVEDDIAFGPENLMLSREEIEERINEVLDMVSMQRYRHADPSVLSGGQKQRIAIASILAMHPKILILDEPGSMLDPRGRRGIRRIARELNESGLTVVLITHFLEEAVAADRVVVMHEGSIALQGTPHEVFSQRERLLALQMDVPYAIQIVEALGRRGIQIPPTIHMEELEEALCALSSTT